MSDIRLLQDIQISSDVNHGPIGLAFSAGNILLNWLWRFEDGSGGTDDSSMTIEVLAIAQTEPGDTVAKTFSISHLGWLNHPACISHQMIADSGVSKVEYAAIGYNYWRSLQFNFDFTAGGGDPKPFKVNLWAIGN